MTRFLSLLLLLALCYTQKAVAQVPNLPTKAALSETILSATSFSNATQPDTVVKPHALTGSYTLEVVARVNAATGRGLDMEARNAALNGFRLSLDAANLKWTAPLNSPASWTRSLAGQDYTIRIAVKNDSAFIYQNGAYIQSQPLSFIGDIVGGTENTDVSNYASGPTLIPNWAGTAPNNTGKPSDYGWAYSNSTSTSLFATANSTVAGTSRYMDVNASSGSNLHTYNGATYTGRLLYIRWDGSAIQNAVYRYPVTLEANTVYNFSMLDAYISNATGAQNMTVGVGTDTTVAGRIASHVFATSGIRNLVRESFSFTSQAAGQYYITINGNWGLFSIGELSVKKISANPRFIFGKNYPSGAVDMQISSVTYEDGAYAPAAIVTGATQNVTVTGNTASYLPSFNTSFIVPGKTDLHLTGDYSPLVNATVSLNSSDAWLFFDNVPPATVKANWLDKVNINGVSAANNPAIRVAIYKNGTVVIPNGTQLSAHALEAFDQPGLGGTTAAYGVDSLYDSLGVWDNKIRSFRLHRGYMATLANNADGSGYSRVFVANDSDLVVNAMPQGLDTSVSFIRVFRWDWVSKKGKAGWDPNKINATWYYDWNIGGSSADNYNYVAIRQNGGWPAWSDINNKKGVNHLLGFNEPDHTDQSNLTVDQAVSMWPDYMQSGYRIGSPAPANPEQSWITDFLAKTDSLNYRVDFVAIHCYWGGQTPSQWYSRLKAIYNRVKRPLWITEWNNGANWTTESWPADTTQALQKQLNDLKGILQVLDTTSFVERYAEYDWVEYKRALVLGDTLTPAGKYYAADKSNFAYNPQTAFVHNWKLVAPAISSTINDSDYFKVTLRFKDVNGETGSRYTLERKIDGRDSDFVAAHDFTGYATGSNLSFTDSVYSKATYRVKAYSKAGDQFAYGRSLVVTRDSAPVAPTSITGFALSSSMDSIKWTAASNARSYNLKRSLSAGGPFTTIAARTTQLAFEDDSLQPATTYYYVVSSLNSAGESANSTVLQVTTKNLVAPASVLNPHAASGDAKAVLTWDFQYDAKYNIYRSEAANGVYDSIATNVDTVRYEDVNRENDKTYYYKIVAQNAAGRSPESPVLTATPRLGHQLYIGFDEDTGRFAADAWGGYHGTLGSTVNHVTGHTNGAVQLDGASTSYVSLANAPVAALHDFTIATWVKMDALSTWMRIFDFGTGTSNYMFLTPQASASNGLSTVRFVIKNSAGTEQQLNYAYAWPLNTWTHLAVVKSGSTASLYINGDSVAAASGFTLSPSDLGNTNQNYIGKSQWNDPMLKGAVDEFKIYNRALSGAAIKDAMKQEQFITFSTLPLKQVGDADFDPGATASSGLPVAYTSSDTTVATVVNGMIRIKHVGTTTITALQPGDSLYAAAQPVIQQLAVHCNGTNYVPVAAAIPNVYALDTAVDAKNTLYMGYGPSSLTVTANASGGTAPYSYLWNTGDTVASQAVSAAGTYSVTVADAKGCTAQAAIDIQVLDVRCGNNSDKVMICHNNHAICVASAAVQAHLNHGDKLGNCNAVAARTGKAGTAELQSSGSKTAITGQQTENNGFMVYPNPAVNAVTVWVNKLPPGAVVRVFNASGQLVFSDRMTGSTKTIPVKSLAAGLYYVQVRSGAFVATQKIVKE